MIRIAAQRIKISCLSHMSSEELDRSFWPTSRACFSIEYCEHMIKNKSHVQFPFKYQKMYLNVNTILLNNSSGIPTFWDTST